MKPKKLYIHTIGCQMNVYDSDQMAAVLHPMGYQSAASAEAADLILVNTCSIRAKAEQKLFSFLGRLAPLKKNNPDLIIGVGGCVAQQEGGKIIQRVPHTDFVFGTQAIPRLPGIVDKVARHRRMVIDTEMSTRIVEPPSQALPQGGQVSRFVTIMHGCDNFCTYCVVPHVRGREASRRPQAILDEIRRLVDAGTREVTLLGQNVNSYGRKEGLCSFAELLNRVNAVQGLARIRFTTSHPKDLSNSLMAAFRDLDKLCPHIHLPVQSGSDRVLHKMNRKYDSKLFLDRVAGLRKVCPQIAVTSDIIVGFPGESGQDFQQTLDLLARVEFDGIFAFKYSDRPQAPAARFPDKVAEALKAARLQEVLALQDGITRRKNNRLIGSLQSVLVEGTSKKQGAAQANANGEEIQWSGRSLTNKIVNFNQDISTAGTPEPLIGRLVEVKIKKAFAHSLWGRSARIAPVSLAWKGEKCCAA